MVLGEDEEGLQGDCEPTGGMRRRVTPEVQAEGEGHRSEVGCGIIKKIEHQPVYPQINYEQAGPQGVSRRGEHIHLFCGVVNQMQSPQPLDVEQAVIPIVEIIDPHKADNKRYSRGELHLVCRARETPR